MAVEKEFLEFLDKNNVKDWQNPLHYYDYHAAWKAGDKPDENKHWSSKFKHNLHPNRYIKENDTWMDTKYNEEVPEAQVNEQTTLRNQFEDDYRFSKIFGEQY